MANEKREHFPYKPRVVLLRPRHNNEAPPWRPSTARFIDETTSAAHYVDNSAHFRAMERRRAPRQQAAISGAPFDGTTTSGSTFVEYKLAPPPPKPAQPPWHPSTARFSDETTSAAHYVDNSAHFRAMEVRHAPRQQAAITGAPFDGTTTSGSTFVEYKLAPPPPKPAQPPWHPSNARFSDETTTAAHYVDNSAHFRAMEVRRPPRQEAAISGAPFDGTTTSRSAYTEPKLAPQPPKPAQPAWHPSTARFSDETTSAAHYVDNSAHFRAMEVRHAPRQEAAITGAPFDGTTTSGSTFVEYKLAPPPPKPAQPAWHPSTARFSDETTTAAHYVDNSAHFRAMEVRRPPRQEAAITGAPFDGTTTSGSTFVEYKLAPPPPKPAQPPWHPSAARFSDETTTAAHYVDNSAHFRAMEVRHRPRQEAAISGAPFDDTTTSRWAYRPFEYIVSERTKSPQKEQVIVM